jgi:hypothetical protein
VVLLGEEGIYQHRFRLVPKSSYGTAEPAYSGEFTLLSFSSAMLMKGVGYKGIGVLRIELFQAKSGIPRLGLRLLKWVVPPENTPNDTTPSKQVLATVKSQTPKQRKGAATKPTLIQC